MEAKSDFGLIGLAVMGQNLVLNLSDKGWSVVVFNRTVATVDDFLRGPAAGRPTIRGAHSVKELAATLARPRRIMLLVKAGEAVDQTIAQLLPHLEPGDLIIDGGNSHFADTVRRAKDLESRGLLFIGAGVSGGEEGARHGPSIMPGGDRAAWPLVKEILQSVAAKTDGEPCCDWVGSDGAGHYVKMVHNGIEYGDMQLISEAYHLMKDVLGMGAAEMSDVFARWNKGELDSYLIGITAAILKQKDADGTPLVENILDAAGQKGTGKWTSVNALDLGMPVTLIGEAVFARCLSAMKAERVHASEQLAGPLARFTGDKESFVEDVRAALLASKIVSYAQGYMLLREAAREYGWNLDYGRIALMWRGGCIIRSVFLGQIKSAFDADPDLPNLLLDPYFRGVIARCQPGWRRTVAQGVALGIPMPAFTTALSFFDGYRAARLPANLLQAQRDYFGAHTYERVDSPRGKFFHTNWTGQGMDVKSGTYNA